jgi:hypothetical protein
VSATDAIDVPFQPLAVREPSAPPQLLDALRPAERVALMAEIADVVSDVIEKQGWFKQIGTKKHVLIQGWTFIGGLGGCSAKTTHTEKIDGGFKAHAVVVRVDSGVEVGSADQVCMSKESKWRGKDDYALIGMASTRACSRALSSVFRHVVELAGYSATPAEEMVKDDQPFEAPPAAPPRVDRVPQDELLALARAAGIFPPGAPQGVALAAFGAWAMANGVDFNDGRRRKLLTDAETQAAKALLEDLASAAAMLGDRTGGDEPPPRMAHRTQGRLFALMGERLGKDHDDWHDFAAQHGVALATKGGKPTFTGLSEAAARALIAKLEVIPPSEWAKPPAAPAPVADEDDEDGLLAYARERIGEPR